MLHQVIYQISVHASWLQFGSVALAFVVVPLSAAAFFAPKLARGRRSRHHVYDRILRRVSQHLSWLQFAIFSFTLAAVMLGAGAYFAPKWESAKRPPEYVYIGWLDTSTRGGNWFTLITSGDPRHTTKGGVTFANYYPFLWAKHESTLSFPIPGLPDGDTEGDSGFLAVLLPNATLEESITITTSRESPFQVDLFDVDMEAATNVEGGLVGRVAMAHVDLQLPLMSFETLTVTREGKWRLERQLTIAERIHWNETRDTNEPRMSFGDVLP